jgi:hypothetical protein
VKIAKNQADRLAALYENAVDHQLLQSSPCRTAQNSSTNDTFRATEAATDFGCTKVRVCTALAS